MHAWQMLDPLTHFPSPLVPMHAWQMLDLLTHFPSPLGILFKRGSQSMVSRLATSGEPRYIKFPGLLKAMWGSEIGEEAQQIFCYIGV